MDPITLSILLSLIGTAASYFTSLGATSVQTQTQKDLQEDSQEFTNEQRQKQNEYQQQMHQFNLVNDPSLKFQGLKQIGMSDAAAIQAIAGGSDVGWAPTSSANGSGIATVPNLQSTNAFSNFADIVNKALEAENTKTDTEKKGSEIVYTQQMCDESKARMDKIAFDKGIEQSQLDIAKMLADSQVAKNESEIRVNEKTLQRINSEITLNLTRVANLNADTALKYVEASKYVAETNYYNAATGLAEAQTGYVSSQTLGQDISNLDSEIVLKMKQFRLELSKVMSCDVDADEVTRVMQAMALGNYESVDIMLQAMSQGSHTVVGDVARAFGRFPASYLNRGYHSKPRFGFSDSFKTQWNLPEKSYFNY